MNSNFWFTGIALGLLWFAHCSPNLNAMERPNVVIVITDDQGYGDLGCHGNPVIKTPNIDHLVSQSVSLSNYHVAPTCSPSRSSLLTGHWTNRTGVWHTINGRSMLRANEITLGELFRNAGYETGMFGKWHLGDNYPYRPEDRGFSEVYRHGGGGVGQTPDVWDNSYFDGAYFHNQKIEKAKGFCTDVFFSKANSFITQCVEEQKPFLAYISTNAPHGPLHCPQKYLDLYPNQSSAIAAFFGMISNIDDNVGDTRKLLKELGVYENTIFIFTTDNGTAGGDRVFNAGMRGKKGSEYDGGHRVPFVCHWPASGWNKKRDVQILSHAVDVVPTLLDVCEIKKPKDLVFDGKSIRSVFKSFPKAHWPDRFLVTDSQRVRDPIKWRKSAVMSQNWRLVNGVELYEIRKDPGQKTNVAKSNPAQVKKMRDFYEAWWAELQPTFAKTTEIYLGHSKAITTSLTAHDWIQNQNPPWNQGQIRRGGAYSGGRNRKTAKQPGSSAAPLKHTGHWAVKVIKSGLYEVRVLRWPAESKTPIQSPLMPGKNVPGASNAFRANEGTAIPCTHAVLRIDGNDLKTIPVQPEDAMVSFRVSLEKGSHQLAPFFKTSRGEVGCFYAVVTKLD